mmetsp:Transcript_9761/g.20293  ORF Transcript_9761/g.20293 Transcript_9761/m.20293 type:complete len:226 (+) Transcript_9761:160-837(+)
MAAAPPSRTHATATSPSCAFSPPPSACSSSASCPRCCRACWTGWRTRRKRFARPPSARAASSWTHTPSAPWRCCCRRSRTASPTPTGASGSRAWSCWATCSSASPAPPATSSSTAAATTRAPPRRRRAASSLRSLASRSATRCWRRCTWRGRTTCCPCATRRCTCGRRWWPTRPRRCARFSPRSRTRPSPPSPTLPPTSRPPPAAASASWCGSWATTCCRRSCPS